MEDNSPKILKAIQAKESSIHLIGDRVLKVHNEQYFKLIEKHSLMGEDYWLSRLDSPHVVNKIAGWDGGIWMERLKFPLGTGMGISAKTSKKLHEISVEFLRSKLNPIVDYLESQGVRHRDIHPGNLLWDGERFKLIDFVNATFTKDGSDIKGVNPKFGQNDRQAVENICNDLLAFNDIRQKILSLGESKCDGGNTKAGLPYHPIPLPSCDDIKSHNDKTTGWLYKQITTKPMKDKLKILDLGCANGYFSFKFSKNAREVVAIDYDKQSIELNEALREYHCIKNIAFIHGEITEKSLKSLPRFDLCIFLNVHHWLVKKYGDKKTEGVMRMLSQKCNSMWFMTAHSHSISKYKISSLKTSIDIGKYLQRCGWKAQNFGLDEVRRRYLFKCISKRIG